MENISEQEERFNEYIDKLGEKIGHKDRQEPMKNYCIGLILPGERKSVEPMAARINPEAVRSEHQSMHHFIADAPWSDDAVLNVTREYALPNIETHGAIEVSIADDSGMPKKGKHSVGVMNQYCGALGKNANCQVAVTLSLANETASLPVAYRLYLPETWANDQERRRKAGIPEEIKFEKKWEISLKQIDEMLAKKVSLGTILADAGYGDTVEYREGLTSRELKYVVGISKNVTVWEPGKGPLPPKEYSGQGQPAKRLRRTKTHQPVTVKELAFRLPCEAWQDICWRQGSQGEMKSRFAAVRVRPAHRDYKRIKPRPEEWLLIEWPIEEAEPTKYWLSTLPDNTPINQLVRIAKMRWIIERDFQELKDEIGLDHFEGRGWRGFHHHAILCIVAYVFLVAERTRLSPPGDIRISPVEVPPLPPDYKPRGAASSC